MDMWEFFQLFNIINLLNTMLPKGAGELIVLLAWFGFFALLCLMVAVWALTRELTYTNSRARITMEDIGILIHPGGSFKEFILPRKTKTYTAKMGDISCTWTIEDNEYDIKSNGSRCTYFHPELPTNMSFNHLVRMIRSAKTAKLDNNDEVTFIPIENITWTSYEQDGKIQTLGEAYAADISNPLAKFAQFAPWVALIMAIGMAGAMIFIVLPRPAAQAVVDTVTTTTATTLTTLAPAISRVRPPI